MPGTASLAGGVTFLAEVAKPSTCHDGALCGIGAMGDAIEGIFGLGLVVMGAIALALAYAVRRNHLKRRAADLAVPVARVIS